MSTLKRENSIIYLDGKPHKYSDVVMLPTNEKAPQIGMISTTNDGKLQSVDKGLVDMYTFHQQFGDFAPVIPYQHLYFLSDEEIKEGDWCIMLDSFGNVFSNPQQYNDPKTQHLNKGLRKIIATTDDSIDGFYRGYAYQLPQPSESFIEAFVESFNKGQQITEVMVECETVTDWDNYTTIPVGNGGATHKEKQQLKINPKDNTITIRKVKDNFEKTDVMKFMELLCVRGCFRGTESKIDRNYNIAKQTFTEIFGFDYENNI